MFRSTPLSLNFLLLLLLDFAIAKSTSTSNDTPTATANLFNFAYPVVAYPVSTDKHDATTYLIACPTDTNTASCEFEQPFTLIQGPKTVHFAFVAPTASATQTFILDCTLHGITSLGCLATGIAPATLKSLSAPKTTTEALSYTGDAARGFFRSVSLVGEQGGLMTYTPGGLKGNGGLATATATATAMVGEGVWTSESSSQSLAKETMRTGSVGGGSTSLATALARETTSSGSVGGASTSIALAKETNSATGDVASSISLVVSSSVSGSGSGNGSGSGSASTTSSLTASTTSGALKGGSNGLLMVAVIIGIAIGLRESIS
ncbi:hypothetical protein VTL71DRAFT_13413 [Oculimacula yallundae]|uniref:Uncharacterized protein n=1 Tax=Oculimacula yallundae TaxID=86028 RepID=A0ABR4CK97_9HELO